MSLNPRLLDAMTKAFGAVRVRDEGQPLEGYYAPDPVTGRTRLYVVRRGETYEANCFKCNDHRMRMAVNHRYGIFDPKTGGYGSELWKCYNEECQSDYANRARLRDIVFGASLGCRLPHRRDPEVVACLPRELEPVEFPGVLVPLTELPASHPAVRYVKDTRGFDPAELVALWGVGYAEHVPPKSRGAMSAGRLIAPITHGGVMVGWQARHVGEADWKEVPKYLTYCQKSLVVYGLDQAEGADVLTAVEGVTDVWRYGPGAVCGLGKGLSARQCELVASRLRGRPFVVVPDRNDPTSEPKFFAAAGDIVALGHRGPVASCCLAPGLDPAMLSRPKLRGVVAAAITTATTGDEPCHSHPTSTAPPPACASSGAVPRTS